MDPNATLSDIRNLIGNITSGHMDSAQLVTEMYSLLYQFEALDEWLSKGGFLPDDWKRMTCAACGGPMHNPTWGCVRPKAGD